MRGTYTPSGSRIIQPTLQFLGGYVQKCDHRPGRAAGTFSYEFLAERLHKTFKSHLAGFTLEHLSGCLLAVGPQLPVFEMDTRQELAMGLKLYIKADGGGSGKNMN